MADYGLTPVGLSIKTLDIIIEEKRQELRTLFGDTTNIEDASTFGQLINISAERELKLWELMEQIYLSQYPSTASQGALDQAVSLNGIVRKGIIFSTIIDQAFWGTPGTIVPAGTVLLVPGKTNSSYALNDEVTLGAGVNQIQEIDFSLVPASGSWSISFKGLTTGLLAFDADNTAVKDALELLDNIDEVTVTGNYTSGFTITFIGDNVKYRKNPELTTNTISLIDAGFTFVVISVAITTAGVYQAISRMTAVTGGASAQAPSETLTEFESTISGIDTSLNETSSIDGAETESDPDLKIRRSASLAAFGGGTADAIRSGILSIDQVLSCLVYENDTLFTDVSGRPGKSFEAYVFQVGQVGGGSPDPDVDQLIGEQVFQNKSAGMQAFGTVGPVYVIDTAGNEKQVFFSRPDSVDIYLTWELTVDAAIFPVDGPTLVGDSVVTYGNEIGQGVNVIVYPYLMEVLNEFNGIKDVVTKIGKTPSPTLDDNVIIDDGTNGQVEVSIWQSENVIIIVNSVTYNYNPVTGKWES